MLLWFDTHPAVYWALAWISFCGLTVVSIAPALGSLFTPPNRWTSRIAGSRWLYVSLLIITFFAFRWPMLAYETELNPDESQLIAGAITLQHDPVYWRSVNGMTNGPLDTYSLLLARLFFLPLDYGSARLVGSLFMLAAILAVYRLLWYVYNELAARIAVLPIATCLAGLTHWDLVHFSSEHFPVALLSLGLLAVGFSTLGAANKRPWAWSWCIAGILIGATPFAKLQAAPMAAVLGLFAITMDALSQNTWRQRLHRVGTLAAAALLVPLALLLMTLFTGTTGYAWKTYVVQNLLYSGTRHYPHWEMITQFVDFIKVADGLYPYLAGCIAMSIFGLFFCFKFSRDTIGLLLLTLGLFVTSFIAVIYPGRLYTHYLLFMIVPTGLLAATTFCACWEMKTGRLHRGLLLLVLLGVAVAPQVWSRSNRAHPYLGQLNASQLHARSEVARTILQYATRGESLGQWGWMARYHVQTRMPHATTAAQSEDEITATPLRGYYRDLYLARLQAMPPPVFIDSVGPESFVFKNRDEVGHETWPELAGFINRHYSLVADVESTRIYVRNDRHARRAN